ncbi:hypothetical protein EDC96DRAFT_446595 [Choanephora cucurbitarum]|nr:hypothetical protein EDC96DRAFT_446595 [Choanephora cucurbitarum]
MPSQITYKDIVLFKTEYCRNWDEKGVCRYGKRCRYAHGQEELRPILRSNQYKTKICRAFHENGTCSYGIRCTFIHRMDEEKCQTSHDIELNSDDCSDQQQTSMVHEATTTKGKKTVKQNQEGVYVHDSVLRGTDKTAACSYISSHVWDSMMGLSSYEPPAY